jgi:hypothetical protein
VLAAVLVFVVLLVTDDINKSHLCRVCMVSLTCFHAVRAATWALENVLFFTASKNTHQLIDIYKI